MSKWCWNPTCRTNQAGRACSVSLVPRRFWGPVSSRSSLPLAPDSRCQAAGLAIPHGAGSGGLFQCVDHLLQDVRAVVCYLLEDGVGKLLQLCIVALTLF